MSDLSHKLSWGLVHLGYNVIDNYACSNRATHEDIKETWVHKDSVPSEEKILKAYEDWVESEKKIQYQRDREIAYPEIKEQLDLLYHDMTAGKGDKTGEWYKAVNKVKTDNPKPE